jgi:excisionase family DNA binding protein
MGFTAPLLSRRLKREGGGMEQESPEVPKPKLLTIVEVAERLNVAERFVRRLIYENRIPRHKFGDRVSHVRILETDLETFIENSRIEASA